MAGQRLSACPGKGQQKSLVTTLSSLTGDKLTEQDIDDLQKAPTPGALFVALAGDRFDGHDFVADAAQRGAAGAIVSRPVDCALPQVVVTATKRSTSLQKTPIAVTAITMKLATAAVRNLSVFSGQLVATVLDEQVEIKNGERSLHPSSGSSWFRSRARLHAERLRTPNSAPKFPDPGIRR